MGILQMIGAVSLLFFTMVGCSTGWPEARLANYLGAGPSPAVPNFDLAKKGPVTAGLVVVNDVSATDSAPQLSEDAFESIKKHVQALLTHEVSMALVSLESSSESSSRNELVSLRNKAKDQQLNYLVLAIVSSTEIEVPDRLPLQGALNGGGMRGALVGYRAENFALAELAFLDVQTGQVIIQSDGQAWASLERLDVPLESNIYPVVRRNLEIPPIYPTSEEHAHDVMRAVASSDAIDQAVMEFKESWKQVRG